MNKCIFTNPLQRPPARLYRLRLLRFYSPQVDSAYTPPPLDFSSAPGAAPWDAVWREQTLRPVTGARPTHDWKVKEMSDGSVFYNGQVK
jgi:hypothetical protein